MSKRTRILIKKPEKYYQCPLRGIKGFPGWRIRSRSERIWPEFSRFVHRIEFSEYTRGASEGWGGEGRMNKRAGDAVAEGKSFHVRLSIRPITFAFWADLPRYHRTRIIIPRPHFFFFFACLRSSLPAQAFSLVSFALSAFSQLCPRSLLHKIRA